MKKLFTILAVALSMTASLVFAKTEGIYVGLDVIRTSVDLGFVDLDDSSLDSKDSDSNISYGLN